ncbi:LOW QUALITY PROTEIN: growth hormone secretagogue receptor type 1-like [Amphiura filiformis]|uniref:LOW QUALITY PROTEIN: growth hormone secretagogue receptor type 1-like n=1 Tax=Amphiura filiformis TaxID=82378 RepID=UPI003B219660
MENEASMSYSYSSGAELDCPDGQWIVESLDHAHSIELIIPFSQRFMLGIVAPIITIIGLFLNLAFFFVLIRVPDMHTTTNFYLANLAIADCLFLIFSTVINMWQSMNMPITGAQPFQTDYGCGMFFWMNYLCYFASISFVTLVTLDRYTAVCHAIRYRRTSRTKIRTTAIAAAAWGVACVFAAGVLPNYIQVQRHCYRWPADEEFFNGNGFSDVDVVNFCYQSISIGISPAFLVIQIVPFIIAMIASLYCYINIISKFSNSGSSARRESLRRQQKEHKKRRNQIALMLLVMASCFFICEVPFLVSSFIFTHELRSGTDISHETKTILTIVSRIFLYLNSSINPLIYSAISPTYRRAFVTAFSIQNGRQGKSSYRVASHTKMVTLVSMASEKSTNDGKQADV